MSLSIKLNDTPTTNRLRRKGHASKRALSFLQTNEALKRFYQ